MAHVIATHRLRFVDAEGSCELIPSALPQPIPDRFIGTPYFMAATQSGWIRQVELEPTETIEIPKEVEEEPAPRKKRNA